MFLNKYNNKILSPIVSILALVFLHYCADPEENSDDVQEKSFSNTLGSQIIGDGSSGPVEQYFYNFDDAIDATYFMYGKTRFDYSYDKYISIFSLFCYPLLPYRQWLRTKHNYRKKISYK